MYTTVYEGRLSPERQATVVGMNAGTSFKVRVRAVNNADAGDGKESTEVNVATTTATPPTAPEDVQLVSRNGYSMTLSIQSPIDTGGVPMSSYLVERVIPSSKSCSDLLWQSKGGKCSSSCGKPGPCDENVVDSSCSGILTYEGAEDFCRSIGAKVCSYEELQSGLGSEAGCQLDDKRVWTSTHCQTDLCESNCFFTVAASSVYVDSVPPQCTYVNYQTSKLNVRCCSEDTITSIDQYQAIESKLVASAYPSDTTFYIDGLTANENVWVQVKGKNSAGWGSIFIAPPFKTLEAAQPTIPPKPTILDAQTRAGSFTVRWYDPITSGGAALESYAMTITEGTQRDELTFYWPPVHATLSASLQKSFKSIDNIHCVYASGANNIMIKGIWGRRQPIVRSSNMPGAYTAPLGAPATCTNSPACAFDLNSATYWDSQVSNNIWLQVDIHQHIPVCQYKVTPYTVQYAPKSWILYGSKDQVDWKIVDQQQMQNNWDAGISSTYNINKVAPYRYYKFSFSGSSRVQVASISIGRGSPEATIAHVFSDMVVLDTTYSISTIVSNVGLKSSPPSPVVSVKTKSTPEKPYAPFFLPVEKVKQDSLTLKWTTPTYFGGAHFKQYVVQLYDMVDGSSTLKKEFSDISINELTISGLEVSTSYKCKVRGDSKRMEGIWSTLDLFKTAGGEAGNFTFEIGAVSLIESTESYVVKILRTFAAGGVVNINVTTVVQASTASIADYTPFNKLLRFENNEIEKNVTLDLKPDDIYENPDEFIELELRFHDVATTKAEIGAHGKIKVTILDDGDAGTVGFVKGKLTVKENAGKVFIPLTRFGGKSGTVSTNVLFHAWSTKLLAQRADATYGCGTTDCCSDTANFFPYFLNGNTNGKQTVDMCDYNWDCRLDCYRKNCGDNEDGDYKALSNTVIFADGVTETQLEIGIINDEKFEFLEQFEISLSCGPNDSGCDLNGAAIDDRMSSNTTCAIDILDDNDVSQPGRQARPHVVQKTGGSITVGWQEPDNKGGANEQIKGYELQMCYVAYSPGDQRDCVNLGTCESTHYDDCKDDNAWFVVYNGRNKKHIKEYKVLQHRKAANAASSDRLSERTSYIFRTRSFNSLSDDAGCKNWSPYLRVTTSPVTDPDEPSGMAMISSTGGSLTLTWTDPYDNGGSDITGYRLYIVPYAGCNANACRRLIKEWTTLPTAWVDKPSHRVGCFEREDSESVDHDPLCTLKEFGRDSNNQAIYNNEFGKKILRRVGFRKCMTPLTAERTYYFQIQAQNSRNFGKISPSYGFKTAATSHPEAPTIPKLVRSTGGSILLQFAPPENTGGSPITGYLLQVLVDNQMDPSVDTSVWRSVPLDDKWSDSLDSTWSYAGITQRVTAIPTNGVGRRIPLVNSKSYRFRVAAKNQIGGRDPKKDGESGGFLTSHWSCYYHDEYLEDTGAYGSYATTAMTDPEATFPPVSKHITGGMIDVTVRSPYDTGGGAITGYMVQIARKTMQSSALNNGDSDSGNSQSNQQSLQWEIDSVNGSERWHIAYDGRSDIKPGESLEPYISLGRLSIYNGDHLWHS
jgi:hypothetical protein